MGIMDTIFRNTTTPVNPTGVGSAGNTTVGIVHNAPAVPPSINSGTPVAPPPAPTPSPAPSSPLDTYSKLWQTPVDDAGKPIVVGDPLATNVFNFDPAKIQEQAATLDFTKDIKPELLTGLVVDGALNPQALLELLNTVQQKSFAAATLSMGNMVNQGIQKNNAALKGALPRTIDATQLDNIPVDNEVLNHPAVQPLVKALRVTAFNSNPNAKPAEIAKQVEGFILGLSTALQETSPKNVAAKAEEASKQQNWGNYFSM